MHEPTNNLILNLNSQFYFNLVSCPVFQTSPGSSSGVMLLTATAHREIKRKMLAILFYSYILDQQVKQESQYQKLELCYRLQ